MSQKYFVAILFALLTVKLTAQKPCMENYTYRRAITISNSGIAQTNYLVEVKLDIKNLIAAGKIVSGAPDVRFTNDAGTPLQYWIDNAHTSNNQSVWVQMPTLPAGTSTIYLFYGNPGAASQATSSIFTFFDAFNTLNTTNWSTCKGANVTSGELTLGEGEGIVTKADFTHNFTVEAYVSSPSGAVGAQVYLGQVNDYDYGYATSYKTNGASEGDFYLISTTNNCPNPSVDINGPASSNGLGVWGFSWNTTGNAQTAKALGVSLISAEVPANHSTGSKAFVGVEGNANVTIDWLLVRPLSSPNITNTLSTTEEAINTTVNLELATNAPFCASGGTSLNISATYIDGATYTWAHETKGLLPETGNAIVYTGTTSNAGRYTVRANIGGNPSCSILTDQIDVVIDAPVNTGDITPDNEVCAASNSVKVELKNYSGSINGWQYQVDKTGLWYDLSTTSNILAYTNLQETHSFRAVIDGGTCGTEITSESIVTVYPTTNGGALGSDRFLCEGTEGTLTLTGNTGEIAYWEQSADKNTWTTIMHTNNSYTFSPLYDSVYYRVSVKSGVCPAQYSDTILVAVNPTTQGGQVTNGKYVCSGENQDTVRLIGFVGDVLKWEFSPGTSGPWSENSSHADYFIYQNLTNTTYYRAIVESPGCAKDTSIMNTVIVESQPDAGDVSGSAEECASANSGTISLSSYSSKVVDWLISSDKSSWKSTGHTYDTINYTNLSKNKYYKGVVNTKHEVCTPDTSAIASVIVSPETVSGNLYSAQTSVCEILNQDTVKLNNETGKVQYWQSSPNGLEPWATINVTNDYLPFQNLANTTVYRAVVKSGACPQKNTSSIKIQVDKESQGGNVFGGSEVCELVNKGGLNLLNYSGSIALWQYSVDGTTWKAYPNTSGATASYDSLVDTTQFRVIVKSGLCPNDTSTIATITVNPLPDVAITASDANLGDPVKFQNNSTIPGGTIQSWFWDFGDNESSASKKPSHTYLEEGSYHVSLTATSNKGCVDSTSIGVSVFGLPDVKFTWDNVCLYRQMEFTNTSTIGSGTTFTWDFGDGTASSSSVNAIHTYTTSGTFNVTLKAISMSGGVDSVVHAVTVYARATPNFTITDICEGQSAVFSNHTTPTSLNPTYSWNFGDGQTDTRTDPNHMYVDNGNYVVWLKATTYEGCVDSANKIINVHPQPNASFAVEDVPYGEPSIFLNQSNIVPYEELSYEWDFGDASTSVTTDPVYYYGAPGVYQVVLTVTSANGCSSSEDKTLKIFELPEASYTFENVCDGDTVEFVNQTTISSGALRYEWDFNDGATSTESSPVHLFAAPGNYNVQLISISNNGARDTVSHAVVVYELPVTDFGFNEACEGQLTYFENQSETNVDPIIGYVWDFGDGSNSIQENPEKEFLNSAIYKVNLKVTTKNGCESNKTKNVILHPNPVADFFAAEECLNTTTEFVNSSSIVNTLQPYSMVYNWDFGDGDGSVLGEPTHKYKSSGLHKVQLKVVSNKLCSDSLTRYVEVYSLPPANAGRDTTVVKGFPIVLDASGGTFYEWSPEIGLSDISIAGPEARPMETTQYIVRVIDENNCLAFDTITVTVEDKMKIVPSNILTPNNNNENDTWRIINIDSYPEATIMIFDRNGKMIYKVSDYQNDWAGVNQNGDILPDGTYYYVIVLSKKSSVVYKGAITILRDK